MFGLIDAQGYLIAEYPQILRLISCPVTAFDEFLHHFSVLKSNGGFQDQFSRIGKFPQYKACQPPVAFDSLKQQFAVFVKLHMNGKLIFLRYTVVKNIFRILMSASFFAH